MANTIGPVGPYLKAVRKFKRAADWLTDTDAPMILHLETLARQLDEQVADEGKVEERTAALFGTTWNRLKKPVEKNAVKEPESEDPDLNFS